MKHLFFLFLICLFISCEQSSLDELSPNDTAISIARNFEISDLALQSLDESLDYDEEGRIVSFDYNHIKNELTSEQYIDFLKSLLGENVVIHYEDFIDFDQINQKSASDEILTAPEPHLFHDKRNWRRPGCRRSNGSICVIYL